MTVSVKHRLMSVSLRVWLKVQYVREAIVLIVLYCHCVNVLQNETFPKFHFPPTAPGTQEEHEVQRPINRIF